MRAPLPSIRYSALLTFRHGFVRNQSNLYSVPHESRRQLYSSHIPISTALFSLTRQTRVTRVGYKQCRSISTQSDNSTIYALSSAPGRAAIATIRISGDACLDIYRALCPGTQLPKPRVATLRTLYNPVTSPPDNFPPIPAPVANPPEILDPQSLVLYFPAPNTVTGEDVLELHVHGGPAIVKAVLSAIPRCIAVKNDVNAVHRRISYAEPGEFTQRAFFNGRLDLTQVEALSDTLSAVTEQQRRLAVRGTGVNGSSSSNGNKITQQYEQWRQLLLEARGELEALIDFSEDQHFDKSPAALVRQVAAQVRSLVAKIRIFRDNAVRGELLRSGIRVCLLGEPNAGKSSLLNALVGRDAAIVSREAGTTRDIVEVGVDIRGWYCRISDTAGLRDCLGGKQSNQGANGMATAAVIGEVEQEGMRRARERVLESDLIIVVLPIESARESMSTVATERKDTDTGPEVGLKLDPQVLEIARRGREEGKTVTAVINKWDRVCVDRPAEAANSMRNAIRAHIPHLAANKIFVTSCKDKNQQTPLANKHNEIGNQGHMKSFLSGLTSCFEEMTSALSGSVQGGEEEGREDESVGKNAKTQIVDLSVWEESLGASERHRRLLEECQTHLQAFLDASSETGALDADVDAESVDVVVAAEHLRAAADCLGKITGRNSGAGDVEEVLGVVFEKFCVGK